MSTDRLAAHDSGISFRPVQVQAVPVRPLFVVSHCAHAPETHERYVAQHNRCLIRLSLCDECYRWLDEQRDGSPLSMA